MNVARRGGRVGEQGQGEMVDDEQGAEEEVRFDGGSKTNAPGRNSRML